MTPVLRMPYAMSLPAGHLRTIGGKYQQPVRVARQKQPFPKVGSRQGSGKAAAGVANPPRKRRRRTIIEKDMHPSDAIAPPSSISSILRALVVDEAVAADGKISLDEMVEAFGNRAFGILYLLFGLPNCFPMPPGIPVLCGIVVAVVSIQMMMGRERLVLPRWLGQRRVDRHLMVSAVSKSSRFLERLERFSRPRYPALSESHMRRAIGLAGLALAIALMAPIPIFGGIPAGIAVTILGLAFTQRDGILIAFGLIIATPVALAVTSAMVFALVQGAAAMF